MKEKYWNKKYIYVEVTALQDGKGQILMLSKCIFKVDARSV